MSYAGENTTKAIIDTSKAKIDEKIEPTELTTLSAPELSEMWQETTPDYTLKVVYIENGGSNVADIRTNRGAKITEPTAPKRTGYTFGGWFKDEECKTPWDFVSDTVENDMALYALWTQNEYKIQYIAGAYGGFDNVKYTGLHYGDETPAPPVELGTYTNGYIISEWSRAMTPLVVADVIRNARYKKAVKIIRVNINNGATVTYDGTTYNEPFEFEISIDKDPPSLTSLTPIRGGYVFGGWFTDLALTKLWDGDLSKIETVKKIALFPKWIKEA